MITKRSTSRYWSIVGKGRVIYLLLLYRALAILEHTR